MIQNPELDGRVLSSLTEAERDELRRALLGYFVHDRKLPSHPLHMQAPFNRYHTRTVSAMIVAFVSSGLLVKSGYRRDAAYQLTDQGQAIKDNLLTPA